MTVSSAAPAADRPTPSARRAGFVALSAIALAYAFNTADRQLLAILQEPIAREFGLSDSALGLLGVCFAIGYALASFPLACLADRGKARAVITWTFVAWSLTTVGCGLAASFALLAISRFGVALGEAGCAPAGHALIARTFPPTSRGMAMGVLMLVAVLGAAGSAGIGGALAETIGWRATFVIFGVVGVAVAPVIWLCLRGVTPSEPVTRTEGKPFLETFRLVCAAFWRRKTLRYMTVAAVLKTIGAHGLSFWVGSFLIRVHHMNVASAGLAISAASLAGGVVGALGVGLLVDHLGRRDERAYAAVPALLLVTGAIAVGFFTWSQTPMTAILAFGVAQFVIIGVSPPVFALVQRMAPVEGRATAAALIILCINVLGQALGPMLFGVISDVAKRLGQAESLPVAVTAGGMLMLVSAFAALAAVRHLANDVAVVDAEAASARG